ncbi:MAG: MarR family transcriptional regulator, partial [Bacteroidales bacterium]|nr:MarR family transcriptional regulator [Bacteroidales bacterium]
TPKYAKLLRLMQRQPSVTIDGLKKDLGINKSAVQRLLGSLKEKGYIESAGEGGGWLCIIRRIFA